MNIEFIDKNLEQLFAKGYAKEFPNISNDVVEDFLCVLSIADSASCIEDLIKPPPYKGLLQQDGSYQIALCGGWILNLYVEISDDGNRITVVSLSKANGGNDE